MRAVKNDATSDSWQDNRSSPTDVEKHFNLAPYDNAEGGDYRARFPNIDERKVMRKIDIRVVPVLCVLYLLAFLDRSVTFARISPRLVTNRHFSGRI